MNQMYLVSKFVRSKSPLSPSDREKRTQISSHTTSPRNPQHTRPGCRTADSHSFINQYLSSALSEAQYEVLFVPHCRPYRALDRKQLF